VKEVEGGWEGDVRFSISDFASRRLEFAAKGTLDEGVKEHRRTISRFPVSRDQPILLGSDCHKLTLQVRRWNYNRKRTQNPKVDVRYAGSKSSELPFAAQLEATKSSRPGTSDQFSFHPA